jgi:hypothetical protein
VRSNEIQVARGVASVRLVKGVCGVIAGAILFYLGATGKVIPPGGLDQSAEWGRALGESGVKLLACGLGAAAALFFGWWTVSAVKVLRST